MYNVGRIGPQITTNYNYMKLYLNVQYSVNLVFFLLNGIIQCAGLLLKCSVESLDL